MYGQIPVQNNQIYGQNYALPVGYNPKAVIFPNNIQYQVQQNNPLGNPAQMKVAGNMRNTYTPGQIKKGQMIYQVPQQPLPGLQKTVVQILPKEHNHGNYIQNQLSPVQANVYQSIYPNQPNQLITQTQIQNNQAQNKPPESNNFDFKKSASLMTVKSLANIPYSEYPKAEYSDKPFYNISGYASNSYNGKVRNYNEDRTKTIVDFKKTIIANGQKITPNISYFSVFDGHGGKACSDFLRDNLHNYLFNSRYFPASPLQAIKEAFIIAENEFYKKAYDPQRNALLDRSGSCALIILVINDMLYAINLGDCRALLSSDSGTNLIQITRDHKPNDPIEKRRIEKCGAKVYYANKANVNGIEVELKEKDYGEGFTFPYRISPGGIAVSRTIGDYYIKLPNLGGKPGALSSDPCVYVYNIKGKIDFLLLGSDGIFDRLDNDKILNKIWQSKKKGKTHEHIHNFCAEITDGIIKYSMEKNSVDNVSIVFVAFKNFEEKMKDPNFEYIPCTKCIKSFNNEYDFGSR